MYSCIDRDMAQCISLCAAIQTLHIRVYTKSQCLRTHLRTNAYCTFTQSSLQVNLIPGLHAFSFIVWFPSIPP